jgi:hypothetical protein
MRRVVGREDERSDEEETDGEHEDADPDRNVIHWRRADLFFGGLATRDAGSRTSGGAAEIIEGWFLTEQLEEAPKRREPEPTEKS